MSLPPRCLIVQPIDRAGYELLRAHGIAAVDASAAAMEVVAREVEGFDAVITRGAGLNAAAIAAGTQLKVIGVHGSGYDPVDIDAATRRGICVLNTPDANVRAVAEHAFALILAAAKGIRAGDEAVRSGDFTYKFRKPSIDLFGKVLGLVGFGRVAKHVARFARSFGMEVVAYSPSQGNEAFAANEVTRMGDLPALFSRADIVSLHLPLSQSTRGIIGADLFRLMKPGSILVNTGRGGTVVERDLIRALRSGKIAMAGLDVYETEDMAKGYELFDLPNVVLTPHSAGSSADALRRTATEVATGVIDVLAGRRPGSPLNPGIWNEAHRLKGVV